ncbi:MAG: methylmalonyl-CoA epimerase [Acidobacteriota bacterium]|nr:methylmalonyl-CoA epimerase [Acidobacteriota bacterium]|tara:strand:- start:578 stop:985 length:408 start_codon:yes stop_codon:yes gene_type:complete
MKVVLDHIGIAVDDLEKALGFYRDGLGLNVDLTESVPSQAVRAHFIETGNAKLELLEATSSESPIARSIDRRGVGLHHITFRVDDLVGMLDYLRGRGVQLIDDAPRDGAEGALIAFIHPRSTHGVLIELKQDRNG